MSKVDTITTTEYLGHAITARVPGQVAGGHDVCIVEVVSRKDEVRTRFQEAVDAVVRASDKTIPADGFPQWLAARAISRARAAIVLDKLGDIHGKILWYPQQPEPPPSRSDEVVQMTILTALRRVRRLDPIHLGHVPLDAAGICLLEAIRRDEFDYNMARLKGAGLVQQFAAGDDLNNYHVKATELGLQAADRADPIRSAAAYLVESIIASVDSRLPNLAPAAARKLAELTERVAHAESMAEIDVSEVAQACRVALQQCIWALLDHFQVPQDERPADPELTRDGIRVLLRHVPTPPTDTDSDLVEGLVNYVLAWLGPLGQFVHKFRHPKGFPAEKAHASRCVTYTYLLINDLMDVAGY